MISIYEIDLKNAEKDYVSGNISYSDIAKKYNVPASYIAYQARRNSWRSKRSDFRKKHENSDIYKLQRTTEKLENILEKLFDKTEKEADLTDMKALKDLISALKEAVGIRRNLLLLPFDIANSNAKSSSEDSDNELQVYFEDDAELYSV